MEGFPVLASLLVGELFLLAFLSRKFIQSLTGLLLRLTKSQKLAMRLIAICLLPGTLIHELAHMFAAKLLFIPTGRINLMPTLQNDGIKLGSVEVGTSDPLRRMFVGFAPVFCGILFIFLMLFTLEHYLQELVSARSSYIPVGILLYFIFVVSNTMFASKKDREGSLEAMGIIIVIGIIAYFSGLIGLILSRVPSLLVSFFLKILSEVDLYLALPIGLDFIFYILLNLV